jgi:hypothetical protein
MPATTNGRDQRGRFATGNKLGKGRPTRQVEADNLRAMYSACPPERLMGIINKLCVECELGNLEAIRILLRHALPIAVARVEIETDDFQYRVAGSTPEEKSGEMLRRIVTKVKEQRAYKAEQAKLYPT